MNLPPLEKSPAETPLTRFMIWIDGVGGYLVCTEAKNSIGQCDSRPPVSISINGDLDQEHAVIESVAGGHLLHPVGSVVIDGRILEQPIPLRVDQTFQLGTSVALRYVRRHPWSSTAMIEFASRHRTDPWSDAVLLSGDSIVMGPQRANHVCCRHWKQDVILVRQADGWYCRSEASFSIDGAKQEKSGRLSAWSRVEGSEFSFTLEPIRSATPTVSEMKQTSTRHPESS